VGPAAPHCTPQPTPVVAQSTTQLPVQVTEQVWPLRLSQ
jgi:hypothetical protein